MDKSLTVTVIGEEGESPIVLHLRGPVLISNLFDFQAHVREVKAKDLVIDMTEVPYIDSAGVGVLVGAYVHRQKESRNLVLVGVQDRVRSVLQVTQVERFFTFANKTAS
ncbi:anti-sigma-factor antagonist [Candidatus Koribacter versatilis Ellin345]|uniref:Anti-sigma factor antagonist n=1 Tax=Koribacter versatilis (strain Ellin345) TaxID=204669 RepID=Q1IH74_KORVE|nr:STAS domain-containing protein [Candidatus Koribacter versatilis]ABF43776.1 anti-sigma-factor antagonist [Candidatus Koribacter versatilis Ellin345]